MIDNLFADRLMSGERILWTGRPRRGLLLGGQDIFLIPFSLLWFGFTVFWTVSVIGTHAPEFFIMWGLMFAAMGLYLSTPGFAPAWATPSPPPGPDPALWPVLTLHFLES